MLKFLSMDTLAVLELADRRVLGALRDTDQPLTAREISKATNLDIPLAVTTLRRLTHEGLVGELDDDGEPAFELL